MAAGQIGKVPGASPRNPTDARSREVKEDEKKKCEKSTLNAVSGDWGRNPILQEARAGYY